MADFWKILESKIDFSPIEQGIGEKWFRQVERDNLFANQISSSGGGGFVQALETGSVSIDWTEGITLKNKDTGDRSVNLDPDGDAWFGSNIDNPSTTTMFIISNEQKYNDNLYGAGDLLIGDDSTGKANIWWDASTGQLYFRSGTTVSVTIGSGGISATWGVIGGWTIGATTLTATGIVLDAGNDKITVGTDKIVIDGGNQKITVGSNSLNRINIDGADNRIYFTKSGTQYIRMEGDDANIIVGAGTTNRIEIDGFNGLIKSTNFSAGASGFQILANKGDAEFNNITARGTFRASVFQKDNISATGGQILVAKAAAAVYTDVTSPAGIGAMDIDIEHDADGVSVIANLDVCRVKGWNGTEIIDVWFTVSSQVDNTTYSTYSTTCNSGYSKAIQKGMAVVNYGPNGAGLLSLEAGSPTRIRVLSHTGAPYSSLTTHAVLGNLDGNYGASSETYGLGVGDYSGGNYFSYNADGLNKFIIGFGDGSASLDEDGLQLVANDSETSGPWAITWLDGSSNKVTNLYTYKDASTEQYVQEIGTGNTGDRNAYWGTTVYGGETDASIVSFVLKTYETIPLGKEGGLKMYFEQGGYLGTYAESITQIAGVLQIPSGGFGSAPPTSGEYGDLIVGKGLTIGSNDRLSKGAAGTIVLDWGTPSYGFISSNGSSMYLNANAYYSASGTWKTTAAGYAAKASVHNTGSTYIFEVSSDNTSRAADAALAWTSRFRVHAGGSGAFGGGLYVGDVTQNVGTAGRLYTTDRTYIGKGLVVGYAGGSPYSDDGISFYIGTTRYASMHVDTTWLRLDNESLQSGVYTPQYYYAADGIRAGSLAAAPTGNQGRVAFVHAGGLTSGANSTSYYGLPYHTLSTYLTSGSWEARTGTLAATKQDLSALFGAPAGIYGVVLRLILKTSATHPNTATYFQVGPGSSSSGYGHGALYGHGSSMYNDNCVTVGCDSGGDIWANIGGTATVTTYMRILGYFI
jgi:hypothetical protein